MATKTSETRIPGTERRQAIWPWLVMPLATLALFCALIRLEQIDGSDDPAAALPAGGHSNLAEANSSDGP